MFKDDRICPTDFWNNDRVGLVLECLLWTCILSGYIIYIFMIQEMA